MASQIPTLRWGITTTGHISSWFVEDLVLERKSSKAKHIVQAIGASSLEKAAAFAKTFNLTGTTLYAGYDSVYEDPNVDIVHIGTPTSFHKDDCLKAINAGKHVLCEKAFTMTAKEAKEVFAAAKAKGVFVMEGMWTRFNPLVIKLMEVLHRDKLIGNVLRTRCDGSFLFPIEGKGMESRYLNPALGAGSLLDLGVYCVNWGLITLDPDNKSVPQVNAACVVDGDVEVSITIVLTYQGTKQQGILTSSSLSTASGNFCRIYGTKGFIDIFGYDAPAPTHFVAHIHPVDGAGHFSKGEDIVFNFDPYDGRGFFWEADAVALNIQDGLTENSMMPWSETIRVMEIMDEARKKAGTRFPQDDA